MQQNNAVSMDKNMREYSSAQNTNCKIQIRFTTASEQKFQGIHQGLCINPAYQCLPLSKVHKHQESGGQTATASNGQMNA